MYKNKFEARRARDSQRLKELDEKYGIGLHPEINPYYALGVLVLAALVIFLYGITHQ